MYVVEDTVDADWIQEFVSTEYEYKQYYKVFSILMKEIWSKKKYSYEINCALM